MILVENTATRENYNSIDLLKLICAFLVVGIHTEPFGAWEIFDRGFGIITRCAVPVFFMVSSFLFFKKRPDRNKLVSYVLRVFYMYIFWIAVYVLLNIKDESGEFFILNVFKGGGYSSLWFLQALLVSVPLVFLLNHMIKNKKVVCVVCIVLYLAGLIFGTYYVIFSRFVIVKTIYNSSILTYIGTRNGVFYAPIYISLGLLVADHSYVIKRRTAMIGMLVSLVLLVAETLLGVVVLGVTSTIMWVMMIPLVYFIFHFTISFNLKENKVYYIIRKMSTGVYVTHRICMKALHFLSGPLFYVGVLLLSCAISFIFAIIPRDKVKFLKYIC